MKKHKIVYFGDHSDRINHQFLKELYEKSDGSFEIFVTGYETGKIDRGLESDDIHILAPDSPERFYHEYTADTVVVTSGSIARRKIYGHQRTIYYMKQFDRKAFAGTAGDIDEFYSPSEDTVSEIVGLFSHIKAVFMEEDWFVDFLIGSLTDVREQNDPELFVMMGNEAFPEMVFWNTRAYLISDAIDVAGDYVQLRPNGSGAAKGFLSLFSGVVKYSSRQSKEAFLKYVEDNSIDFTPAKEYLYEGEKLPYNVPDGTDVSGHITGRAEYIAMLDDCYVHENCTDVKVSIIMARYNNPVDLIMKALDSIAECGHENIEVIIIDDGSKDDISDQLPMLIKVIEVKYYYCEENRGVGEARNAGVEKAAGDYIFFLNCEDTMYPGGLRYLLAHAVHYGPDVVSGIRIITTEDGESVSESFRNLSGDTFKVYRPDDESDLYSDVLITNKLMKRAFITGNDLRFTNRIYEDQEYSASVYSSADEIHYVAAPVYNWHKHRPDTTVPTSVDMRHFYERLKMDERAWDHVPEQNRKRQLISILESDFNDVFSAWSWFSGDEKDVVLNELYDFLIERKDYLPRRGFSERADEIKKAILKKDIPYFDYIADRYYYRAREGACRYHIVSTHAQLLAACLLTLEDECCDRLIVDEGYDLFDDSMLYRIRTCGLFDDVTTFSDHGLEGRIYTETQRRPDESKIVKATMMDNAFFYAFRNCEYSIDTFICYDTEYAKYVYPDYLALNSAAFEYRDSREIIASSYKKNRHEVNGIMGHIYDTDTSGVRNPDVYCVRNVPDEILKNGKGSILSGVFGKK